MSPLAILLAITLAAAPDAVLVDAGDDLGPQVIRLKVGAEVVGEIVPDGFDEAKGVRIRRVDDDALLDVGFDQMLPEDARRIRAAFGYQSDEPEPIFVEAMKVKLLTGDELLGVITEQGAETFKLRQGTKTWELKRANVRDIVPVKVDALEVYDPEELFAEQLVKRSPATALDHYNLAIYCESLQLWKRVQEELEKVQELDPQFKADIVSGKHKRAGLRLESSEDSALLSKALRFAQRDGFDVALGLIDEFLTKKPGSALRAEFERSRRAIAKNREKWIRGQVIFHFFLYLERQARAIATEPKIAIKEARKRIEAEATKAALEATATALKVTVEEARSLWEDPKRMTASLHYASYGSGTWTLGSIEAVFKGLVKEEEKKADPNAGAGKEGATLEDKIAKLLEQKKKEAEEAARKAKEAQSGGPKKKAERAAEIADIPPTEDEWWDFTPADEKSDYLLAWWADHDPHVNVKVDHSKCPVCTGNGFIRFVDRAGETKWVPCSRCKGAQIDRILRYR